MTLVEAKEYERYCSCGAYGWDYSEEWRVDLRFAWDEDWYEIILHPLLGQLDHWTSPYAVRHLWAGNIRRGDGLQDMINRAEQPIAETLAAYAKAKVK